MKLFVLALIHLVLYVVSLEILWCNIGNRLILSFGFTLCHVNVVSIKLSLLPISKVASLDFQMLLWWFSLCRRQN